VGAVGVTGGGSALEPSVPAAGDVGASVMPSPGASLPLVGAPVAPGRSGGTAAESSGASTGGSAAGLAPGGVAAPPKAGTLVVLSPVVLSSLDVPQAMLSSATVERQTGPTRRRARRIGVMSRTPGASDGMRKRSQHSRNAAAPIANGSCSCGEVGTQNDVPGDANRVGWRPRRAPRSVKRQRRVVPRARRRGASRQYQRSSTACSGPVPLCSVTVAGLW